MYVSIQENEDRGLLLNCKKMIKMVFSPVSKLKVKEDGAQQEIHFYYLRSMLVEKNKCNVEIKKKIAMAKTTLY